MSHSPALSASIFFFLQNSGQAQTTHQKMGEAPQSLGLGPSKVECGAIVLVALSGQLMLLEDPVALAALGDHWHEADELGCASVASPVWGDLHNVWKLGGANAGLTLRRATKDHGHTKRISEKHDAANGHAGAFHGVDADEYPSGHRLRWGRRPHVNNQPAPGST